MRINTISKKIFIYVIAALILVLVAFFSYSLITGKISFGAPEEGWDGVSVATSFSGGNGTHDNPYLISTPEEFVYFKNIIESDQNGAYKDKYYLLTADINMGNKTLSAIGTLTENQEYIFSGTFDGDGYSIKNYNNVSTEVGENYYYGLFTKTENATIKNLSIDGYTIKTEENSNVYIGLISHEITTSDNEEDKSLFENILIRNLSLDINEETNLDNISLITNTLSLRSTIHNLYVSGEIVENNKDISFIKNNLGTVNNVIVNINDYTISDDKINNLYNLSDDTNSNNVLKEFNKSLDGYHWEYDEDYKFLKDVEEVEEVISDSSTPKNIKKAPTRAVAEHTSGVDGSIVYVNDLASDYNYYMGLNYATSLNNDTPTMENKNLYGSSNLVKTTISYNGNSNYHGYVSLTELQDTYVYFKYYVVNDNGTSGDTSDDYILVELLDSPFSNRPNNKAFHGWKSNDNGVYVYLDSEIYVRYAKVPVTYNGNTPNDINISFDAIWEEATVYSMVANTSWSTVNSNIKAKGFVALNIRDLVVNNPTLPNGYFTYGGQAGFYSRYTGYDVNGNYHNNERCTNLFGCTYYNSAAGTTYNENTTYFKLTGSAVQVTEEILIADGVLKYVLKSEYDGKVMTGYFVRANTSNGSNCSGNYDNDGDYIASGNCGTGNYYQMLQVSDNNVADINTTYYYLVTRDTNIVVATRMIRRGWTSTNNKPFTLTSVHNGTNYRSTNNAGWDVDYSDDNDYVKAYADVAIENIYISSGSGFSSSTPSTSTTATNYFYGNFHNIKLGRGITSENSTTTSFIGVLGGNNGFADTGSASSPKRYRMIIESGVYNVGSSVEGPRNDTHVYYVDESTIFGSDIDRVKKDNDKLIFGFVFSPMWSGYVHSTDDIKPGFNNVYKSGSFGTGKFDHATGVYFGARGYGRIYTPAVTTIEGGWFYNVVGGPMQPEEHANRNKLFLYIKGGSIDNVNGGAGTTTTYANRIISMTGGQVNYSLFGGSNAYAETSNAGLLQGDSYIYVGGNATVGDSDNVNDGNTLWEAEAGSVFGNGHGNLASDTVGSNDNAYIVIDGSAHILGNVYGGGNFGATGTGTNNDSSETKIKIIGGTIDGNVYGGGNRNGGGTDEKPSNSFIDISGGVIKGDVYGGSNIEGTIYGNSNVTVNGGTINGSVYGGGKGGLDEEYDGTYVERDVNVIVNNGTIKGSVYGGSAYGTVNATNQTANSSSYDTTVTINNGVITENVFGGGKGSSDYTPRVVGDITVNINGGNIGAVYGGFDASGSPSAGDVVYLNAGTIGNCYGGGRNASQTTTDIRLQGSTITGDLFGGSNLNGTINTSNVTVTSGSVTNIYGGNNIAGTTVTSNVNVTGGTINGDIYGGGNEASTTTSNVDVDGVNVHDIYGGGKKAGVGSTNVEVKNTTSGTVYGGSNISGNVNSSDVLVNNATLTALYGGNNQGGRVEDATLTVTSSTIPNVFGGGNNAATGDSHVTINSENIINLFGGGNNSGGYTTSTSVNVIGGVIGTVYGGGNEAQTGSATTTIGSCQVTNVYGGGNAAGVDNNTDLIINSSTITNNIYGGGNEGVVNGNTNVYVHNGIINGNAFAGGNGSSAVVYGDSTITIDGTSVIGTANSVAPNGGCVFGSGNAASTGRSSTNNSKATVNLVGGTVYGNVYGGPKMAVVYGTTDTNIGYAAVNNSNLTRDDIIISGTVFGGGESNASGSETYDWNFISVTEGIDVNIDGTGYSDNSLDFIINGSIFGSGNASSSSGLSNIYIKNLGSIESPNKSISIQRANYLEIDSSVIELSGATDRTNEYSDIFYSFNMIDKMVIKNNTTLLLMHNANLLKELYSGVDSNGTLVPAVVDIDDDTKTVTKNVDNRIYMKPGQNLNVTINQAATAYGKVTGMTFFGMYNQYENGRYNFGLYDKSVDYGDTGSASMMVVGGSYVIGLHSVNHDITKDGFYSNFLDDEFTEVSTAYIDPSEIGATGYRWIIGFEAINYGFTLNASKYSSLGTYELQLIDFADGSTRFSVLDFDASGLNQGISLVDPANVPRIGATQAEANSVFGLAMKAETQEWTGHGTTKYSSSSPRFSGTLDYMTDTRQLPPSLMFYLYHTKNIDAQGPLGTVIVTLRAEIPKNAIEYDIKYITITIDLVAKRYNDADSYDASITYDKKYEMPSSTLVNITNQSQFTAYFSMVASTNDFEEFYGHNNSNYRVLTSNNPLPVGTLITMIDNTQNSNRPEYYYFEVTNSVYNDSLIQLQNDHEVSYRLSNFIKMDSTSTNNTYDDQAANLAYYDSDIGIVDEEFLFIFDFKETTVTGNHPDNTILFEMRNNEDRTVYNVLGIRQSLMVYNTFESSNVVLQQVINFGEPYIYYGIDHNYDYSTLVQYNETENRQPVIDTNYESSNMGINISILDRNGDPVSSSLLIGTSININGQEYFADGDGIFRIKLADKVTNLSIRPKITATKDLPVGEYTLRCTLFASSDGLHNSVYENSVTSEFTVYVVGSDNAIVVDSNDLEKVVIGENGLNLNDSKTNTYTVTYESELNNPNLRVEIYKRKVNDVNSTEYESIPFNNLFKERLTATTGNEKYINIGNSNTGNVSFTLNDTLISGTYKIVFKLYDNNQIIDDDVKYVIVKKSVE